MSIMFFVCDYGNDSVIGDVFEGLRPVKKQQLVYAVLNEHIASGAIHAVNMRLYTRDQWNASGAS